MSTFCVPFSQVCLQSVEQIISNSESRNPVTTCALEILRSYFLKYGYKQMQTYLSLIGRAEIEKRRRAGVAGTGTMHVSMTGANIRRIVIGLSKILQQKE